MPASPVDLQRRPSPGMPPAVPDGAEMLQSLLLQGFLILQHVLHLLLHGWRNLDPLSGHELTGCPHVGTMKRRGRARWMGERG